jgi:hypothetical protein
MSDDLTKLMAKIKTYGRANYHRDEDVAEASWTAIKEAIEELEQAKAAAALWKTMAEHQHAKRVYPDMPGLAYGALGATFRAGGGWATRQADIDAAIKSQEVKS